MAHVSVATGASRPAALLWREAQRGGPSAGRDARRRCAAASPICARTDASRRCFSSLFIITKEKNFNRLSVAQVRRVMKSPAATSQTRVATRPHSLPPTDLPTGSTPGALPLMLATPPAPSAFGSVWYAGTQHGVAAAHSTQHRQVRRLVSQGQWAVPFARRAAGRPSELGHGPPLCPHNDALRTGPSGSGT